MSHDMISRDRELFAGPARNSFLYGSYVEIPFTAQNTKHKGVHNHNITMTKSGNLVEPNGTGAIGALGIAGFVM
jgi:hypothetical protein